MVTSGAIPGSSDFDVFKVSHHGSDTSNSPSFIQALDPEVVRCLYSAEVIIADFSAGSRVQFGPRDLNLAGHPG